jgi:protein phosphatase
VPLLIRLAGLTDIGRVRRRNEDSLALASDHGVAVVADGMGGHPGGDEASRIAAQVALDRLVTLRKGDQGETSAPPWASAMAEVVIHAHAAVRRRSEEVPEHAGMGTTLTAMVADSARALWVVGHVGDSRAYQYREGVFRQVTRDDTWVQERVDAQELTPDQARRHPFGHIVTQGLGLDQPPRPRVLTGDLRRGDVYLLCTDGLAGMVEDELIAGVIRDQARDSGAPFDAGMVCRTLVDMANRRGGHDNVTLAVMQVG